MTMISKAFSMLVILLFLVLAFVPSNAITSPAEIYWKTKLGNMPMPKTLKDSLLLGSKYGIVKLNLNYRSNFNIVNQDNVSGYIDPPGSGPPPNSMNQDNFLGYIDPPGSGPPPNFVNQDNFSGYIDPPGSGPPPKSVNQDNFSGYIDPPGSGPPPNFVNQDNFSGYVDPPGSGPPPNFVNQDNFSGYIDPPGSGPPPNIVNQDNFSGYIDPPGSGPPPNFVNQDNFSGYVDPPGSGPPPNIVNQDNFSGYIDPPGSGPPPNSKDLYQIDIRNLFFFKDTLSSKVGTKMKLRFKKMDKETKFLPLLVANSMPTRSEKLQEILNKLSIKPKSNLAQDIEITMKKCEGKGIKEEKVYCATSLEGMVDYVTSFLNFKKTNLVAVSTEVDDGIFMVYTIQKVQKIRSDGNHNIICHKKPNPYAVFYCHSIKSTDLYGVSLVGANGKQTKAVAVCHNDTSSWDPKNYAIQFVQSKPGGKPICHFVTADAVVWFSK